MQAISVEENAVKEALDSILSTLSNDGFVKFENEIKSRTAEKTYRVVDWTSLAAEEPELMREILITSCARFYQTEEVPLPAPESNSASPADNKLSGVSIKAD